MAGAALVFATGVAATGAQAGIATFSGQDDGASDTGPWPNSSAAEASFMAAAVAYGSVRTETFETVPFGTAAGGGTFAIPGASVSITTPYGDPYGGISHTDNGNLYGFNTTPGGSQWLGFDSGTATFTFSKPVNSFGFYTTGVQTVFTSTFTATFNDGASQVLNIPINVNGGASYFGFTDSNPFTSITITNLSTDAWGMDDVAYNSGVPEPGVWAMMLIGLGAMGGVMRSRRGLALAV